MPRLLRADATLRPEASGALADNAGRPGRRLCWRAGKEDARGIWGVSRRRRPRKARFRRVRRGAARCVA